MSDTQLNPHLESNSVTTTQSQLNTQLHVLNPRYIDLQNESINHAGYFEGKESHFKLTIVSEDFAGKRLVARHQMVYAAVNSLLTQGGGTVHALAIHAYTPDEWQMLLASAGQSPLSPNCAGQNQ